MRKHLCESARLHFSEHMDGVPIEGAMRYFVALHLAICPPCKRTYAALAATREALSALKDEDPPAK